MTVEARAWKMLEVVAAIAGCAYLGWSVRGDNRVFVVLVIAYVIADLAEYVSRMPIVTHDRRRR